MYFIDERQKRALRSQLGKQILERVRVRPSVAVTVSEPAFESTPIQDVAAVVQVPEIYEEREMPTAYPAVPEYELITTPDAAWNTPTLRLEAPLATGPTVLELNAAAEISDAIEGLRAADALDAHVEAVPSAEPESIDDLLQDPLLGPLGPLF